MTVKELIRELEKMPKNLEVVICTVSGYENIEEEVGNVLLNQTEKQVELWQ